VNFQKFITRVRGGHCDYSPPGARKPSYATVNCSTNTYNWHQWLWSLAVMRYERTRRNAIPIWSHTRNWLHTSALVAIWVVGYVITLFALRVYFCCGLFTLHFLFFVGVSDSS